MKIRTSVPFFYCFRKYFIIVFSILFLNFVFSSAYCISTWTVLIYVQACNNLKNFAQRNFLDMASIGSNEHLNILVQSYFPQVSGTSRYKIEKGKMVLDAHIPMDNDGTNSNDLVDAMRWAVTKYPAQKYALVLWNHGVGILDPAWGNKNPYQSSKRFYVEPEALAASERIQIDDLTVDAKNVTDEGLKDLEDFLLLAEKNTTETAKMGELLMRGILFNEQSRNYMTNQALTHALQDIKTNILKNNKIDILGMDACLMAMIEVGYQTRHFAKYLIASEEAELAHGWDYAALCDTLNRNSSPLQVAQGIVLAYEMLYKSKIQFYTQSAIDLNYMDDLKKSLDDVVYNIKICKKTDKNLTDQIIRRARNSCMQFSATNYIDLHSFCSEFISQFAFFKNNHQIAKHEFNNLKNSLLRSSKIIEQSVVACVAGKQTTKAKGLSIYFPKSSIEPSYIQTDFGKNSAWTSFISENIRNN